MRTIRSTTEIDRLFKEGARAAHPLLLVLAKRAAAADVPGRVAVVAGKRLGNAVARNRAKRVLREACRRSGGPWPGADVVLVARPGAGAAGPEALERAVAEAVRAALGAGASR